MGQKVALCVFVKTPHLSPVKTRLASDIGIELATEAYLHLLKITQKLLIQVEQEFEGIKIYWAVSEFSGLQSSFWKNYESIWQGDGSLGEKLFTIQERVFNFHEKIIFIGADSPLLTIHHIKETLTSLIVNNKPQNVVLGPAHDGGFYLYAASRRRSLRLWNRIIYSSNKTAAQLIKSFKIESSVQFLKPLDDLDTFKDLSKIYKAYHENSPFISQELVEFISWIDFNLLKKAQSRTVG